MRWLHSSKIDTMWMSNGRSDEMKIDIPYTCVNRTDQTPTTWNTQMDVADRQDLPRYRPKLSDLYFQSSGCEQILHRADEVLLPELLVFLSILGFFIQINSHGTRTPVSVSKFGGGH
jgi:hypothetical protein